MNCKEGDLAVVIAPPDEGALVEVLERAHPFAERLHWNCEPGWLVQSMGAPLSTVPGPRRQVLCIADSELRPLRGGEPERDVEDIRDLTPRELETVAITSEHGVVLWPN